jgi:hypothetical protein
MEGLPQTQQELNDFLTSKMLEQSNQLLSTQILLYSIVDLIIEKELVSKEDLESMIDNKKEILEKWIKDDVKIKKSKKKDDSPFMMHFGEPGEA